MTVGKGFDLCKSCINAEYDPFQCRQCQKGSRFESAITGDELDDDDDASDTAEFIPVKTYFSKKGT